MDEKCIENDETIANLIGALAENYREQVQGREIPANDIRLDTVRKLMLIADSIKGLMKPRQLDIDL